MSSSAGPSAAGSSSTLAQPPSERTSLLKKDTTVRNSKSQVTIHEGGLPSASAEDEARSRFIGNGREVEVYKPGKSSFSQTLLNTLGDLIGTGLLACPIAFAHAGWIFGPIIMILIGGLTLWTLKILLRIIEKDRRMRSFTDVIGYGLGATGQKWVTVLFVIEVGIWTVALVVLFSDTLAAVWPIFTSSQWKVLGLAVVVPTSFVPLRYLSFSSALGIIGTWTLVGILIFSGIATPTAPGSLRDPAPTDLFPAHGWAKLATVFGLILSGFGGHGLIANLIHDMKHPEQADRVCEVAYGISMAVYLLVSICGYLMYGRNVSDEISKDLATTPGFSPLLQQIAVWMVAINPLTKIPLGIRPLSDVVYSFFDLHPTKLIASTAPTPRPRSPASSISDASAASDLDEVVLSPAERKHYRRERFKAFCRPVVRVLIACLAILAGLALPSFERILSLLGSGFGLITVVIIPICAYGQVFGWRWWHVVICVLSGLLAVAGTIGSFTSSPVTTGLF